MFNKRNKIDINKLIRTILLGLLSFLFISPLIWMVSAASKVEKDVMKFPIEWIPSEWNLIHNFKEVWFGAIPFDLYYFNSFKIALISTILTLLISSMAAYSFSKLNYRYKNVLFVFLMAFFLVPAETTLVPRFILINWLGLYDTHFGLILMLGFSIPITFLMRQFMLGISTEYIEAAKMDGAGYFRIYWQIIIPMVKPILATAGILKFIWSWNDYQNPLIFLRSNELYTVTLGMQSFASEFGTNYAVIMMAAVSAILPLIIVFVILQKHVIDGITMGGVKG
ncbi:carbohydrate ABC transporter permease [Alkalihalobacillus sp. 1P02AB]|uniref:carbohydrate ABC transporter permease n=1 Tax=Alkalihalobacillus sp. 1P02AB TaxID=3132260 RepID=UPI0039A44A2A